MSEMAEGWKRVLDAFGGWIEYEATEFGPWTAYFSLDNLHDLTDSERLGWMHKMLEDVIPGRIDRCRGAKVALEDFLPYMPEPQAIETVRSMIDLATLLQGSMMAMSDLIAEMIEAYRSGGLDDIIPLLSSIAEAEEDIRHHMSLFSQGFGKLRALGLEMPDEL